MPFRLILAAGLVLACSSASATLLTWDAAADYSHTQSGGINGVWSYSTTGLSLTGLLTQFNSVGGVDSYSRWNGGPAIREQRQHSIQYRCWAFGTSRH